MPVLYVLGGAALVLALELPAIFTQSIYHVTRKPVYSQYSSYYSRIMPIAQHALLFPFYAGILGTSLDNTAAVIGGVVAVIFISAITMIIIAIVTLIRKSRHGDLSIRKAEE